MADVGHCWWQQRDLTSSAPIEEAARRLQMTERADGKSKKLATAAATATKSNMTALAMANQEGYAKPVKTGTGSRQQGACHTRSLW
eukprot:1162841-Ditylum_brightwellii.AAC.1